jgi:arylsulfatase A-like enzyme
MSDETDSGRRPPNVVVIFTDDQGYGDVGCFGSAYIDTPNLDRMASEGVKFTSFYVSAPVCSPSRSSLMTGCYPKRNGMTRLSPERSGIGQGVLFPDSEKGLNPGEVTLADVLSDRGYATGCVGKWHLGHRELFLPTNHGFDSYFGIPYSNDMGQESNNAYPPLPLMQGTDVVEEEPEQALLTRRYTEEAVNFIKDHRDKPFFLYLPHTMPHRPIHASDRFQGTSKRELYGDVIEEIDWSTGRILDTLDRLGLDDDTLVLFTSDNGPSDYHPDLPDDERLGDAGPLRGSKGTVWEGGMRMPTIARWPGEIPPGTVCSELASTMDILPTVANITGAPLPGNRTIDGENISSLFRDPADADSPHEYFYYYGATGTLDAVRDANGWKLHLERSELYNLHGNVGEETDLSDDYPAVVERLRERAAEFDDRLDEEARPVGRA